MRGALARALLVAALALGCSTSGGGDGGDAATDCVDCADQGGLGGAGGNTGMGDAGGSGGMGGGGPMPDAAAEGPSPLAPRVDNVTCALPPAPPLGNMQLERVWEGLNLDRPLWLGSAPDDPNRMFVVEQGGRILVFDRNDAERASLFLDLRVSRGGNEEGLLGLAFHPDYANNGRFYVNYSATNPRRTVVSQFTVSGADPWTADPASETVLLEVDQPFGNHNGGDLRFGPDGYLYISVGDGGAANDPFFHGQNTTTLLGTILRIDIDRPDEFCLTPYGIPNDNPFAEGRCALGNDERPEIFAWGLRNVWRMSFDRSTGDLWASDVGQDAWEEVVVVRKGANYGWNTVEGEVCFSGACDPSQFEPPVHVYGHDEGRSITGGFVYRGPDLPELWGAYVFADYISGRFWALRLSPGGQTEVTVLADTDYRVTSFGEDADGRLYAVTFNAGILRFRRRVDVGEFDPIPARLSETGCFADTAAHQVAPGVIPFDVNMPLWSDDAQKRRYIALPAGQMMGYTADGSFDFPEGTVLVKTFDVGGRRLETRLLRRAEKGWNGYVYKWRADEADADLLDGHLEEVVEGPNGQQTWTYPSRAQCDNCHTEQANSALGPSARQLNRGYAYGDDGRLFNQLAALAGAGYIELPGPPGTLPRFPSLDDASASFEDLARAVLDTNCASCHRPEGIANAAIDLRATTPFAETGLCDVAPAQGDIGIDDARLIAPGDPTRSVLLQRMLKQTRERMPPLGTSVIDVRGTGVVGAWIQGIEGCP